MITLNEVLELAGKLRKDERQMLVDLLQKREQQAYRRWLAGYARRMRRAFAQGKLKPERAKDALVRLHRMADEG